MRPELRGKLMFSAQVKSLALNLNLAEFPPARLLHQEEAADHPVRSQWREKCRIRSCCFSHREARKMKLGNYVTLFMLLIVSYWTASASVVAQARGGALTVRYATLSPFVALLAGILILLIPRLLNYIVAIYLIL